MGFFDLSHALGIIGTIVSVAIGVALFLLLVKFLASLLAEDLFAFGRWSGRRSPIVGVDIPPKAPPNAGLDVLRARAAKWPDDLGACRDLADALARHGHHRLASLERQRFLDRNLQRLEPATVSTLIYRNADSYVAEAKIEEAVEELQKIIRLYPDSREASFAQTRINSMLDKSILTNPSSPRSVS